MLTMLHWLTCRKHLGDHCTCRRAKLLLLSISLFSLFLFQMDFFSRFIDAPRLSSDICEDKDEQRQVDWSEQWDIGERGRDKEMWKQKRLEWSGVCWWFFNKLAEECENAGANVSRGRVEGVQGIMRKGADTFTNSRHTFNVIGKDETKWHKYIYPCIHHHERASESNTKRMRKREARDVKQYARRENHFTL